MWKDIEPATWDKLKAVVEKRGLFEENVRGSQFLWMNGKLVAVRYRLVGQETWVTRADDAMPSTASENG